jgi:hypothetical protein
VDNLFYVKTALGGLLGGLLTSGFILLFKWLNSRGKIQTLYSEHSQIRYSRIFIFILSFLLIGIAIIFGYIAYYNYMTFRYSRAYVPAAGFLLLMPVGLLALAPLRHSYDVIWDRIGLEGPGSYFAPAIGRGRVRLLFKDIIEAGTKADGSYYVSDDKGRRILWGYTYHNYHHLNDAIMAARPDLFDDKDGWPD